MTEQIRSFCWGTLYHMLGVAPESQTRLRASTKGADPTIRDLSLTICAYEDKHSGLGERNGQLCETVSSLAELLGEIVRLTGEIFDPPRRRRWPKLGFECRANPSVGRAFDNPKDGYSRNPFKRIRRADSGYIALAAAAYLLRSHALFFCRPKSLRNYDAAKVALNDLHQAYQLAWRLYQNLGTCHHSRHMQSLTPYYKAILARPLSDQDPGTSPYFVFNLLLLCDVFRGNIYHKVDYIEEADRHYRHAQACFTAFRDYAVAKGVSTTSPRFVHRFVSPTIVKAVAERSKVQFDRGRFLESLMNQLWCVEQILALSKDGKNSDIIMKYAKRTHRIWECLNAERPSQVPDRAGITHLFGDPCALAPYSRKTGGVDTLRPDELASVIRVEYGEMMAEILARIGFTLFTLQPRVIARNKWGREIKKQHELERRRRKRWLKSYFRFDQVWKKCRSSDPELQIAPSDLGVYCETLLDYKATLDKNVFTDKIERRFAWQLRGVLREYPFRGDRLDEAGFYNAILATTTQNIANLVTIPRRNGRILFRRGYRHRRTSGDLSEKTVYGGLKVVLGKAPISEPRNEAVNKLVVLRRWQSFNPKIPRPGGRRIRGGGYFLLWRHRGIVIDPGYDFIQNFYDEGFSLEDIDAVVVTHSHPDHDDDLSTLMTLVKEWNEFHERTGQWGRRRVLDLFLNESAQRKFSSWLQASDVKIGRVIPLSGLRWDKDSPNSACGRTRGENIYLHLRPKFADRKDGYDLKIEIVPAWHDDVIGKTVAVGLKFHLLGDRGKEVGIVGYTGDTGAYGFDLTREEEIDTRLRVDAQYADCDVLIAHLGDIRIRELSTIMARLGRPFDDEHSPHPLLGLLQKWFESADQSRRRDRVRDFLDFVVTLHLVPSSALRIPVACNDGRRTIQEWLGDYTGGQVPLSDLMHESSWGIDEAFGRYLADCRESGEVTSPQIEAAIRARLHRELSRPINFFAGDELYRAAYLMLVLVSACALLPWQYQYHLGIFGIYKLFTRMARTRGRASRIFVVGELPEELTSYRHMVAHWLNVSQVGERSASSGKDLRAYTGDIGLHIGLQSKNGRISPNPLHILQLQQRTGLQGSELPLARAGLRDPDQAPGRGDDLSVHGQRPPSGMPTTASSFPQPSRDPCHLAGC